MSKPILIYSRNSGTQPESAAGGTRPSSPSLAVTPGRVPSPPRPGVIGATTMAWFVFAMLACGCLVTVGL